MKVDALKGNIVEALSDRLPYCATMRKCAQMTVAERAHGCCCNQKLGPGVQRKSSCRVNFLLFR